MSCNTDVGVDIWCSVCVCVSTFFHPLFFIHMFPLFPVVVFVESEFRCVMYS
jgi:hypothetical protein